MNRIFLDWNRPALTEVVQWAKQQYCRESSWDMQHVRFVFPGRRAGRRFEELLLAETDHVIQMPDVLTVGLLPEQLYEPRREFASDLIQELAWSQALQELPQEDANVLLRSMPQTGDFVHWRSLGQLLCRHHTELAADGLDFSDVVSRAGTLSNFDEHDRWTILRDVQERYLEILDQLELWDRQTARLVAIEQQECHTDKDIILVATVDLNRTLKQMLEQVSDRVTCLIHADRNDSERFDEFGCLRPECWRDVTIPLANESIRLVNDATGQVDEVARILHSLDGRYRADQIIVGMADETLLSELRPRLEHWGVPCRPAIERTIAQSAPYRLLESLTDFLDAPQLDPLAALVRHPDLFDWLSCQEQQRDWLIELDHILASRFPADLDQLQQLAAETESESLVRMLDMLFGLLDLFDEGMKDLSTWPERIREVLLIIYGDRDFDPRHLADRVTLAALKVMRKALHEIRHLPNPLSAEVTAGQALRLLLESVASEIVPPDPSPDSMELLGWLELPLDDAPVTIITSFNEGFVPKSVNSDLFLPNRLRQVLGIDDNERRYARDAYALLLILHSRKDVHIIVPRRNREGDPLAPSRLLFAADPEVIAERLQCFYERNDGSASSTALPDPLHTERTTAQFTIPRPQTTCKPPQVMSITDFKRYLACPYRYYLERVLQLERIDDLPAELSGGQFGDLIHEVLKQFGTSQVSSSTSEKEIRDYLEDCLRQTVEAWGENHTPAFQIQIEQVRKRLIAFAGWQADHASLGWHIKYIETPQNRKPVSCRINGESSILIQGRIDRIDYLPDKQSWMLIDYKTSKNAVSPDKAHRKNQSWIDLQLPLYRHLAASFGVTGDVQLGYLVLPEATEETTFLHAEWTEQELAEADQLALEIFENVRNRIFWPPRDAALLDYPPEAFQAICHDFAFDGESLPEAVL